MGQASFINGVAVTVGATASLSDIRDAINSAVATAIDDETITSEAGFTATIINHQLVLTADTTGEDYALSVDLWMAMAMAFCRGWVSGLAQPFPALQQAQNAEFTVNNIEVIRSSNSAIDDVIEGVTLNLSKEGETQLTIAPNSNGVRNAINSFVSAFNDLNTWLAARACVRAPMATISVVRWPIPVA